MKNFIEITTTGGVTASVNINHIFSIEEDGENAMIKISANHYKDHLHEYFLYITTQDYKTIMALIEQAQK